MKNYIALTRRSVEEKNRPGASHEYQKRAIQEHYKVRHWNCIEVISENISGWKDVERTKINELYKMCLKRKDIDFVLVQVWDRLSRNVPKAFEWIRKFKEIGIEINSVEQWIDYEAHSVNTMLGIYLGMAADESHKISQRVKNATYVWMSRGYWCKAAPIGYKKSNVLDENKKKLCIPDGEKSEAIKIAFDLIGNKGYTVAQVLQYLRKQGYKFVRSSLYRIVENPFYAGMIQLPLYKNNAAKVIKARHQGIISIELFSKVQDQLRSKKFQKDTVYVSETDVLYPLKGVLKCEGCGKNLYGFAPTGKMGVRYPYYSHPKCGVRYTAETANKFIEEQILSQFVISDDIYQAVKVRVQKNIDKETNSVSRKLTTTIKDIEQNEARFKKLKFMLLDEIITKSEFDEMKSTVNETLVDLKFTKEKLSKQLSSIDNTMIRVVETLRDLKAFYIASDTDKKRMILKAIFPLGFELQLEKGNFRVRTQSINSIISSIICKSTNYKSLEIKKRDSHSENLVELATVDKIRTLNHEKKLLQRLIA